MLAVGGFARELEANDRDERGQAVRQVVDRVGGNGNGRGGQPDTQFDREEKQVAQQADRAGDHAVALAYLGVPHIACVRDEMMDNKLSHAFGSFIEV